MQLLQYLREACHTHHEALHVHPLLVPLNRGAITKADYCNILTMFRTAYTASERRKIATPLPDAPVLEWLEADMATHHIAWQAPALAEQPPFTFSQQVGYAYVKQGATLGGQVISKHLYQALDFTPAENRFFQGYGPLTGLKWKEFQQQVAALQHACNAEEAAHSALQMFEMIRFQCDRMLEGRHEATDTTVGSRA